MLRRTPAGPGRRARAVRAAVAATFVVLALALAASAPGCGGGPERPRGVVVVVLDTVRADRCSVLGHAAPTTPSMRRLAARGRVYERCWSPSPWTAPSHASLFTGQSPDRHGLRRSVRMALAPDADTLAARLGHAGYRTAGFSGNPMASAQTGMDRGFDRFELLPGDATMGEPPAGRAGGWSEAIVSRALDWMSAERDAGRRHMVFLNLFDAHLPYDPPLATAERFAAGRPFELVEWGRRVDHPLPMAYALGLTDLVPDQLDVLARLYDAEVATADRALGVLLDGLEALGASQDTVVVVLADHGENLGDHGLLDHMLSVHASLLHVPLVIAAPGVLDAGDRSAQLVRIEDVAPTLLELCRAAPFDESDGLSLLGDARPRIAHGWLDPMLTSQIERFRGMFPDSDLSRAEAARRSVFDGRLHLIREEGRPDRLHDVVADPREEVDLAPRRPEDVRRLASEIDARTEELRPPPR